jgi:ubiquinone/menaquinone biosynthesis C-methylase UbiE
VPSRATGRPASGSAFRCESGHGRPMALMPIATPTRPSHWTDFSRSPRKATANRMVTAGPNDGASPLELGLPILRRMDAPASAQSLATDAETIRLQAEEHPLIEDVPPATASEHCLRLMHLRAYDEAVSHAAGRDVLDVGCNSGYGTLRFVPVARRVVGVDVSPRAIEAASARAQDGHPEFVLTSGFDLPFPDDSFDLVTSFQVLEHVPDPTAYLVEIARVTRPGGRVVLATPNAATRLYPGMAPWNRFHVHEYVATELRDLLLGVFPEVTILVMFGEPELYETEIRRVDAARQRIRRKEEAASRQVAAREAAATRARTAAKAGTEPRPLPVRLARAVLPAFGRAWLRSVARAVGKRSDPPGARVPASPPPAAHTLPAIAPPSMDLETFLRFSVDDLYYADTDLDRAMDLLAVCTVESRLPGR